MQNQSIEYLLSQYVSGRITEKEWKDLSGIMLDPDNEQTIRERIAGLMLQAASELPAVPDDQMGRTASELSGSPEGQISRDERMGRSVLQAILSVDKTAGIPEEGSLEENGFDGAFPGRHNSGSGVDKSSGGRIFLLRPAFLKWSAAAVLVLSVTAIGYRLLSKKQINTSIAASNVAVSSAGIVPGSNKAILTLAGGNQIVLSNAQNGVLSQQGNIKVIKLDNGKLSYQSETDHRSGNEPLSEADRLEAARIGGGAANKSGLAYNMITTPRGGQYQIVLSDGTKVWLNAASSLKFPAVFGGDIRQVELSGEAYFEVAKDKNKPFKVQAGASLIEVLGTNFNIMAYGDEKAIKTTLLEGSVRMGKGKTEKGRAEEGEKRETGKGEKEKAAAGTILQPGEQGTLDINSGTLSSREVNVKAVIAWKDGYYFFDRTSTEDVMRQIARWYDVQIVYQGAVPKDEIVGRIPRTANVSEVLHIMELIGIHFKIEGRKIVVL